MEQTIAALATPAGVGGIAVIRISGEEAYQVASKVFRPANQQKKLEKAKGYTALFGYFVENEIVCDEVVALCFRAPYSYTGEDVIELSCHGGAVVSEKLLRACFQQGAVPAGPGEFTKRAFLSGRISLTQAEAVMDMIGATSKQGAAAAAASMEGALYKKIKIVQDSLITLAGHIAAYTDYPEEDVEELSLDALEKTLRENQSILDTLIDGYDTGAILRRGVTTAIVGSPNVGKSTLLNLLSGFERAIVTPIAGTTRDIVEQEIELGGIRLLLADTAGIRETQDVVESEGIRRSYEKMERAGLILAVFDASKPLSEEDKQLAFHCNAKPALAIINKTDLPMQFDVKEIEKSFQQIIQISAKDDSFLPFIEKAVVKIVGAEHIDTDTILLAGERQFTMAKTAQLALKDSIAAIQNGFTLDAAGVCIDDALHALYALTGEDATQDVIDEVFSKFCVGK